MNSPETSEAKDVALTASLSARMVAIGEPRLLHARMAWERLFSSASPPGATTPTIARETLTRQANRRKHARRKAFRSGNDGLLRALA